MFDLRIEFRQSVCKPDFSVWNSVFRECATLKSLSDSQIYIFAKRCLESTPNAYLDALIQFSWLFGCPAHAT
jgi:hypothetical protein